MFQEYLAAFAAIEGYYPNKRNEEERDGEVLLPLLTEPTMREVILLSSAIKPRCAMMIYKEAMKQYTTAAKLETDKSRLAQIYHNLGTLMYMAQQYPQSVEAYKESMRNNPYDNETRYNLAKAIHMLKQQQQNQENKEQGRGLKEEKRDFFSLGFSAWRKDWLSIAENFKKADTALENTRKSKT